MEQDLLKLIKKYTNFPFPTVCRHWVALDLVELLEKKKLINGDLAGDLAKALIKGSNGDEEVNKILENFS